ncbi:membrane protein [Pedobacter lusitanus]|uniref:Membrane protein n=1 Tax=Pedobacter lusitanus TaxID=1503925 RepID=A0A0D0G1D4_9SPHI|nr:sensor histidine kinase [Pedobacter lusitanus]KIO78609.1 membrane protein [Pedobacter lusitanus]
MNAVKSRSYITVLLHILLWMLFASILLFYMPLTWNIEVPYQLWIKQSCELVFLIIIFYLNSHILVPKLLLKNKSLGYLLAIVGFAIVGTFMVRYLDDVLNLPLLIVEAFQKIGVNKLPKHNDKLDIFMIMLILLITGISTSVTLIQKWQADKQLREALEKDKIGSELSFLKAQINPHFFFNTLNNIYALTHVDVEKSRNALHKLSRMMRYLLYDTQAGSTPLSKEVSFIVDYIELMKLRLNDTTQVTFEGPLINNDIQIAPMLFLPYIENAFKHGVSSTSPSVISIDLSMADNVLGMNVRNTVFNENAAIADNYRGIGLSNTKRRLDLLYPGKHTFSAGKTEDTNEFIVHLTLILDDTELHSGRR